MEVLPELSFPERMKIIVDYVGSAEKLAKLSHMSARVIGKYVSGTSDPSRQRLVDLAIASGVNTKWLAEGLGPIKRGAIEFFEGQMSSYSLSDGHKMAGVTGEPGEGFVHVPRYKVAASAGGGALIHSEQIVDHLAFRADWVKMALGVPVSSLALINVTGDSMEPTLSNGDLILIDTTIDSVDDSGVYVLQFDGKLKVKRLHSKADSVDILSDNPRYPTETLRGDLLQGLNVVGRVVWCGRRM